MAIIQTVTVNGLTVHYDESIEGYISLLSGILSDVKNNSTFKILSDDPENIDLS